MLTYEEMMIEYEKYSPTVLEFPFRSKAKGLCIGNNIFINSNMTEREKKCVLAEEIGHYLTTVGNIMDQTGAENRKQELKARAYAFNSLVGLKGLVEAYLNNCRSLAECAEFLEVTEEFLTQCLCYYRNKYGAFIKYNGYIINFLPNFEIRKCD